MTAVSESDGFEREIEVAEAMRVAGEVRRSRRRILLWQVGASALFLALWQLASGRLLDPFFVSSPIAIAAALIGLLQTGSLWQDLQVTVVEVVLGYVVGVLTGVAGALAISQIPNGEPVARPFVLAGYATPKVALAPVIVIWFGIYLLPKVVLAASLVFFPNYFNTIAGIRSVSPELIKTVRVMNVGRWTLLMKIFLPSASPFIFAAMRMTLPVALIGALIGEFLSSSRGVGYLIAAASSRYDTAQVFAGVVALLALVLLMNSGVALWERRSMRWRPSLASRAGGTSR